MIRRLLLLPLTLLAIGAIVLTSACNEETAEPRTDRGYDYFPLSIGQEQLFLMDSIVLRPEVGGIFFDSVRIEVREVLVDTLRDQENQLWYRGERYDRHIDSLNWRFRQSFLVGRDDSRALRQDDNLEFVKLVFPLRSDQNWDGHVGFDQYREIEVGGQPVQVFADWDYRYLQIGEPAAFGDQTYDDVSLVEGADYENLLNRRLSLEAYARGIGLVYRELEVFETQCQICCGGDTGTCLDLSWREKAEGGFIIRQWLQQ